MKYPMTGRLRVVNGTLKTIGNGKQKIQIDSSITLRRQKMIKNWWKKFKVWFWRDFYG
jgi:hypothetical protein